MNYQCMQHGWISKSFYWDILLMSTEKLDIKERRLYIWHINILFHLDEVQKTGKFHLWWKKSEQLPKLTLEKCNKEHFGVMFYSLDRGAGNLGGYISQNLLHCTLENCAFHSMQITARFNFLKYPVKAFFILYSSTTAASKLFLKRDNK